MCMCGLTYIHTMAPGISKRSKRRCSYIATSDRHAVMSICMYVEQLRQACLRIWSHIQAMAYTIIFSDGLEERPSKGWQHLLHSGEKERAATKEGRGWHTKASGSQDKTRQRREGPSQDIHTLGMWAAWRIVYVCMYVCMWPVYNIASAS